PIGLVVLVDDRGTGDRGAARVVTDAPVRPTEALAQPVGGDAWLPRGARELFDDDGAGAVTCLITTHTVGDQKDGRFMEDRVLVHLAHEADVGTRPVCHRGHLRPRVWGGGQSRELAEVAGCSQRGNNITGSPR